MSFNEYLKENINSFDFDSWLKKAREDFPDITPDLAETLLDTQEGVDEYIYKNYPKEPEENYPQILANLINGVEE